MPKVHVTQENPALNYLPAEQFGEIVFLTKDDFSLVKNSLANEALINSLRHKLKNFDPDDDYMVISGSPAVSAVVFMLLRERTPRVKILRWSNRDRVYQPLSITLPPL